MLLLRTNLHGFRNPRCYRVEELAKIEVLKYFTRLFSITGLFWVFLRSVPPPDLFSRLLGACL